MPTKAKNAASLKKRAHRTEQKVIKDRTSSKADKQGNFFGNTIKELRQQHGYTQIQAAEKLNMSQAQWSSYEKGASKPTLDTIINLAEKFEIEPLALIAKVIDKFKFPTDPQKELSINEYDNIARNVRTVIDDYRNTRFLFKLQRE